MVELASIGKVNLLVGEKQSILTALNLFSHGGRIVAFGINPSSENYDGPTPAVSVISSYMNYPPTMVSAITQMMQTRLAEIQQQLTEMGITGLDEAQPRGPQRFGAGTPPPGMQGPTPQFVGPDK